MITKERAESFKHGKTLYHNVMKNADGSPVRCRVNGVCVTWKTRPDEFKLPVKYGLKDYFYITLENCQDWNENE